VLDFLYPSLRQDEANRARLADELAARPLHHLADLRPFLARTERQLAPSPVQFRFGPEDLAPYQLEGLTLFALRDDPAVSAALLAGQPYEEHVAATLRRLCRPGDAVVDVGANIGVHSFLLSRLVGPEGSVTAVEAYSENCRLILLGVLENGLANLSVWPLAAAEAVGWTYFSTHLGTNGGLIPDDRAALTDGRGVVIPTLPLDRLPLRRPVRLIKIDVEGAEWRVVQGARRLLAEDQPAVITELSAEMLQRISGVDLETYLGEFLILGYRPFVIERPSGRWTPTTLAELVAARVDDPVRLDDLVLLAEDDEARPAV
jgi:FkbM family methyltransferase